MPIRLIQEKFDSYRSTSKQEEENALKEICQELFLAGLSRSGFFQHCAFQGGTCLRIFHTLNRFSEDLDFISLKESNNFHIKKYLDSALNELFDFGLNFELIDRSSIEKNIQTAFIKTDSYGKILLLKNPIYPKATKKISIKVELDCHPPFGSTYETRYLDFPFAFPVTLQDPQSLFAGKMHAILCRPYTKGRDWYDFIWYVARKTPINLPFLSAALFQHGPWKGLAINIDFKWLVGELQKKVVIINWEVVKADVERFLPVSELPSLAVWSQAFFDSRIEKMAGYISIP